MSRHLPALLFLIPFAAALLCVVLGERRRRAAAGVAGGAMLLAAAMAVTALVAVLRDGTIRMHMGGWAPPLGIEWVLDPLAALMALLVGGVGATVLVGARAAIGRELEGRQSLFYASALLLVSGLMGMALTGDLFNMFVFLELGSLSAYALVATGPRRAPGAAMRYLLIGSLGASLYLLGVGFIYATTGTLNMADVAARLPAADPRPALTGLALIIAGLGVKMGLVPLHGWMPAAYSRGPAAASALLAPLATKLAGYALIRVLFWACPLAFLREHNALLHLLTAAGAVAMVYAAARAAVQEDLWRLLAYSSISQMGLVALGAGLGTSAGLTGAVLHLVADSVTKGALLLSAAMILVAYGARRRADLVRLRGRAPWVWVVFLLGGLSLVGVPPLPGFYGKWYVLKAALELGHWPAVAAVTLGTLATIVYVFRLIEALYLTPRTEAPAAVELPDGRTGPLGSLALLLLLVVPGLLAAPLVLYVIGPALPGGL